MKQSNVSEVPRILIVGSDVELSKNLAESLHTLRGYEVVSTVSSIEALELMRTGSFKVLLSDAIGEKSSLEFATEVRKEHLIKPEIVLLSSQIQDYSLFDCHQVGASFVVNKPINMEQLCAVVEKLVNIENRKHERVDVDPKIMNQIYGTVVGRSPKASSEKNIEIGNIGRGGFFYKLKSVGEMPEVGQVIDFEIKLSMVPDTEFKGKGIVRWARKTSQEVGVGVEFLSMSNESASLVNAFVELFKVKPYVPGSDA